MPTTTITTEELQKQIDIVDHIMAARSHLLQAWNKLGAGFGSEAFVEWDQQISVEVVNALKVIDPDIVL